MSPSGILTTVAGTGYAFRADNFPATRAPIGRVRGVAIGPTGDLYLTDIVNNLVLKVDSNGILTIVAYAVTIARTAPARTPARLRVPTYAVWETAIFMLNVLAFMLIGMALHRYRVFSASASLRTYGLLALVGFGVRARRADRTIPSARPHAGEPLLGAVRVATARAARARATSLRGG
jgi:NhaP-type Na+/H+ or K+/H+ antiporter